MRRKVSSEVVAVLCWCLFNVYSMTTYGTGPWTYTATDPSLVADVVVLPTCETCRQIDPDHCWTCWSIYWTNCWGC
jgi:hypothetical protein